MTGFTTNYVRVETETDAISNEIRNAKIISAVGDACFGEIELESLIEHKVA